jgi:CubicO group peptidase (beta-lactamase class C family)
MAATSPVAEMMQCRTRRLATLCSQLTDRASAATAGAAPPLSDPPSEASVPAAAVLARVRVAAQHAVAAAGVPSVSIAVALEGRVLWEEAFGWADVAVRAQLSPM